MKYLATLAIVVGLTLGAAGQTSYHTNFVESDQTAAIASGKTATIANPIGAQSQQWELVNAGGPATASTVINGCMQVGPTCSVLATSTATGNANVATSGLYDYFTIAPTFTGGTAPTVVAHLLGTIAKAPSSSSGTITAETTPGVIFQSPVTISGGNTLALAFVTNFPAHNFFGNNTGSATTPGAFRPACADLSDAGTACPTVAPANTTATANNFFTAYTAATGAFTKARPVCADLSDAGTACPTVAPANTSSTANNFFTAYTAATGAFTKAQPSTANLSDVANICLTTGNCNIGTNVFTGVNVLATWTFWSSPAGNTTATAGVPFTQNVASAWGIIIDKRVTGATKLRYNVGVIDNTANLYNLALYDSGGNKITECGATAGTTFAPTTGIKACTVSSFTVTPGLYFEVVTTNCASTCAGLNGTTALWVYVSAANVGATTNAVLPGTITPPAASYTSVNTTPTIQLN